MRVAIDATPLTCPTGGIRRYVVELTRALALQFPDDEFFLLSDQTGWRLPDSLAGLSNVRVPVPKRQLFRSRWWSLGLPWTLQRYGIDLFHGTNFEVPYLPLTPSVLTVHDLSPWRESPLRAVGAERVRERTPFLLRLATFLLVPSEAIRREMTEYFGIPASRIRAIPLAAAGSFRPARPAKITEWLQATGLEPPYLVALSDAQSRKNLSSLLQALKLARADHPDLKLVLAGPQPPHGMETHGEPGLLFLGDLSDDDLRTLLSGAIAFVYPTLYEGFGLPVLEAMQTGAPVIASQDRAVTEVTGGAALLVDTSRVELLRQAITKVVTSQELQRELKTKGLDRSALYGWRSTAMLTRQTYVEAIGRF